MKTRTIISALAILAAVLTGCSKVDSSAPQEKITFSVGTYATATRAESYKDYENLISFSSKAFLHAEGEAATQLIFGDGETISWNATTKEWLPSHTYYWPKSGNSYVNFVSWYATAGITPTVSETAFNVTATIAPQDRLLVADEAWRYQSNHSTYNYNEALPGVPTLFHHVLSRVEIRMNSTVAEDATSTYTVTVQDATLKGIRSTGTMALKNSDPGSTQTKAWYSSMDATYLWTTTSAAPDVDIVTSNMNLGTSASPILAERSFIPQVLTGVTLELTYTVTITNKSTSVVTTRENDIPASVVMNTIKNTSNIAITQWLPNKRYIYTIGIDPIGQQILLNPTVETDWTDGTSFNATVE